MAFHTTKLHGFRKILLKRGLLFLHTNHFKNKKTDKAEHRATSSYEKESIERLKALKNHTSKVSDCLSLEKCFLKFISEYKVGSKRLFKMTSGVFCVSAPKNGNPILQKVFLSYGSSNV